MKYNINIPQKEFVEIAGDGFDIKDAAILEYIRGWCESDDKNVRQMILDEKDGSYRYTWINFKHLINEMPLLGIKQKSAISRRIAKLEKAGFVKTFRTPEGTLFARLTAKIKALTFQTPPAAPLPVVVGQQAVAVEQQDPLPTGNSTNIILIKHKYKDTSSASPRFPSSTKPNEFKQVVEYFSKRVQELYGVNYVPSWGRDGAAYRRFRAVTDTWEKKPPPEDVIDFYFTLDKSRNHFSLSAAFSADTLNQYQLEHRDD